MQKKLKLSQNLIIAVNTISFGAAAIFGGIGIFAAIANFTKGDWTIYPSGIENLIGSVPTSFFLATLAILFGLLAKFTIKKITDADLLKKSYSTLATISGILTVLFVAVAASTALFALLSVGSKTVDHGSLWLSGFLSSLIAAGITFGTAYTAKKISDGKIKMLPNLTNIVLGVATLSALLMVISTLVNVYGGSSTYGNPYLDDLNDLFNLF